MSSPTREALVQSSNTLFQADSQRQDLLDQYLTSTYLIATLQSICIDKGWPVEFTAIRSDHHDDSDLNPTPPHEGTHAGGFGADCWPLKTAQASDYLDASDPKFQQFLRDLAADPNVMQIGLAGTAWTDANQEAGGSKVFHDDGADHVHIGIKLP